MDLGVPCIDPAFSEAREQSGRVVRPNLEPVFGDPHRVRALVGVVEDDALVELAVGDDRRERFQPADRRA